MHKKMTLSSKTAKTVKSAADKTRKKSKEEIKNGAHSLVNSLHKWGEDYYEAEDYYGKPVKGIPKTNYYDDYRKKADKQ